jgi:hypothetical protein
MSSALLQNAEPKFEQPFSFSDFKLPKKTKKILPKKKKEYCLKKTKKILSKKEKKIFPKKDSIQLSWFAGHGSLGATSIQDNLIASDSLSPSPSPSPSLPLTNSFFIETTRSLSPSLFIPIPLCLSESFYPSSCISLSELISLSSSLLSAFTHKLIDSELIPLHLKKAKCF